MSGPKVVRIVTREEIIGICEGLLTRLDMALAEWEAAGRRHDCITDDELAAARSRRAAIAQLLVGDRFAELRAQAPNETAFLRSDRLHRLEQVAARAAAARTRERRGVAAAATVLAALERAGKVAPDALRKRLQSDSSDGAAVAEALALLGETDRADERARAQALAAQLKDKDDPQIGSRWQAPETATDRRIAGLETRLILLADGGDAAGLADLRAKLAAATAERDEARQQLMLDGLDVETGRALKAARAIAEARETLEAAIGELTGLAPDEVVEWQEQIAATAPAELQGLIEPLEQIIAAHRATQAAKARRAALLKELSGLGYEVAGTMETALVDEGRVLLKKADRPDYGMEVAAAGERLQIRAVAFTEGGSGPELSRDRDAETLWCGDVGKLEAALEKAGGSFKIERAHAIGATPLKRVERAVGESALRSRDGPELKSRTIT